MPGEVGLTTYHLVGKKVWPLGITPAGVGGWGGSSQGTTLQPDESESLGPLLGICCHGSGGPVFSVGVCVLCFYYFIFSEVQWLLYKSYLFR